jgi:hypothetical protein
LGRYLSSKKALSAIVSTLIIVNIVIAMFVIIFAGYVPTIGLTQSQANLWYGSQQDSSRERLSIEMMIFNGTNPSPNTMSIDIYVRNVGQIDVKIAAVYVWNSTTNATLLQTTVQPVPISLPYPNTPIYAEAGSATYVLQFKIFSASVLNPVWRTGNTNTYVAKVVTARGNSAISMGVAP